MVAQSSPDVLFEFLIAIPPPLSWFLSLHHVQLQQNFSQAALMDCR